MTFDDDKEPGDNFTSANYDALAAHARNSPNSTYTIYKSGSTYYANANFVGGTDYSDNDAATVIQAALDGLTPGRTWQEKVVCVGSYVIDNSVSPLQVPSHTMLELHGSMTAGTSTKTMIEILGSAVKLKGGLFDGNSDITADAAVRVIQLHGTPVAVLDEIHLVGLTVKNGYSRGIEINYVKGAFLSDIVVKDCHMNIMPWCAPNDAGFPTVDASITLNNIESYDAGLHHFSATYPNVAVDNFQCYGTGAFLFDSYRDINVNNVYCDDHIYFTAGNWIGGIGKNCNASNLISAKNIYVSTSKDMEYVNLNNVKAEAVICKLIGTADIADLNISNGLFAGHIWGGIWVYRDTGATGYVYRLNISNVVSRDHEQRGVSVMWADYVNLNNVICQGNEIVGARFQDVNKLVITNLQAIVNGAYVQDYPLILNTVNTAIVEDCIFEPHAGPVTLIAVTNSIFRHNIGYVTERSGTATITAAATSIAVAHGCSYTPAAGDIDVKLTNQPTNDIGDVWIDTIGAANFTINCRNVPGAATAIFAWSVRRV